MKKKPLEITDIMCVWGGGGGLFRNSVDVNIKIIWRHYLSWTHTYKFEELGSDVRVKFLYMFFFKDVC